MLRLVWATGRVLTAGLASTNLLQSVVPVLQVWLAGQLIDEVVAVFNAGGGEHYRGVIVLALLQLAIFLASGLLQSLGNISQQLLQKRLSIHFQLEVMQHANSLDLADFENATYYDQLQQAQSESTRRPVQMVSQVFGPIRSLITFGTMIAVLASLSWWIAAAALISPIPAFISDSRYGWWGFQMMRRQSPVRRAMGYLTTLMTTDQYAKEVKLFTAGDYFTDRYRTVATTYYKDTRRLVVHRYLAGFGWGSLTTLASSGTFLYVAILAIRGQVTLGALTVFTQAAIASAAVRAGADSVIGRLPEGYGTALGKWFEGGHQLSGGEWQKVALARAFMRDAQILILDEPTAALDARAEHELFSRITELTEGRIALYISHRFSTARMADRIFVLEDSRLIEQGTHEEFMLREGPYADLFELQAASYR